MFDTHTIPIDQWFLTWGTSNPGGYETINPSGKRHAGQLYPFGAGKSLFFFCFFLVFVQEREIWRYIFRKLIEFFFICIYIPWPFPPVWEIGRIADNTKKQQKQWGFHSFPLAVASDPAEFGWHCWSDTAHPPPSPTTYVASYNHEKVKKSS